MEWKGEFSREWVRKFALFPTEVEGGTKVVWLQYYWKKYNPGDFLCERCSVEVSERVIGHWVTTSKNPRYIYE